MISSFFDHSIRLSLVYLPPNDDGNILKVRDAKVLSLSRLVSKQAGFFFQKISNPPPPCWIYQSVAQFSSPYERTRAFRVDFSVSVEIAGGLEGLRYLFTKMNEIFAIIFVI